MRTIALGMCFASIVLFGLLTVATGTPVQCDDSDANAEETYGKLQAIPPAGSEFEGLADEPVQVATPSKTQHDILKSRNSKFLGVDRSSEEE